MACSAALSWATKSANERLSSQLSDKYRAAAAQRAAVTNRLLQHAQRTLSGIESLSGTCKAAEASLRVCAESVRGFAEHSK